MIFHSAIFISHRFHFVVGDNVRHGYGASAIAAKYAVFSLLEALGVRFRVDGGDVVLGVENYSELEL
jgi:hypothetical protein